jgi:hypothetical protein
MVADGYLQEGTERTESYQSPEASILYTKVAKSAKKELEVAGSFALFATLV